MKTSWKTLCIASSLAALGLNAMALMDGPTYGHGWAPGAQHGKTVVPERMHARVAKYLAELKRKLNITDFQEPAWTAFSTAMKSPSTALTVAPSRTEWDQLSTPERIDKMRQLRNEHQAAVKPLMDQRDEAIKTFYAALDETQKKTFDAEHAHRARRGPMQP
jgi:hypothetical protein